MGSKLLKAITISGRGRGVPLADSKGLTELALDYRRLLVEHGTRALRRGGWAPRYDFSARLGRLAVKNCTDEAFQLPWAQEIVDTVKVSKLIPRPCFNCPIGCAQDIIIGKGPYKGYRTRLGGGAEHMEGAGGMIGALDGGTVLYLTDLCNRLGVEASLIGQSMGLCYECYEKGLIDKKFTDGLELRWGNADAAVTLINKYVNQEGIGKLFAKGPKGVAKAIGKGAEEFLGGAKGIAHTHDDRFSWERVLALAVAGGGVASEGMGVDVYSDPDLGVNEPHPRFDKEKTPVGVRLSQLRNRWDNCLAICFFSTLRVPGSLSHYTPKALSLAVGWSFDKDEALLLAERVITAMRVFNLRRGLTINDDLDVGRRFLEGFKTGKYKGHPLAPHFRELVEDYYNIMGWERKTGIPKENTLRRLGLDELINEGNGPTTLTKGPTISETEGEPTRARAKPK